MPSSMSPPGAGRKCAPSYRYAVQGELTAIGDSGHRTRTCAVASALLFGTTPASTLELEDQSEHPHDVRVLAQQ